MYFDACACKITFFELKWNQIYVINLDLMLQANEISIFFLNWCIRRKIVLPSIVQSLFSHSEISRRNKMKRTHYANTTKMTAEAASVRVVSDYILPNCSRNVYSIQFYQLMNIFLDLRTFYQYFPLNRELLQRLPHKGHVLQKKFNQHTCLGDWKAITGDRNYIAFFMTI